MPPEMIAAEPEAAAPKITVKAVDGGGPPPPPTEVRDAARAARRAAMLADVSGGLEKLEKGEAAAEAATTQAPDEEDVAAPTGPDEATSSEPDEEETDPDAEPTEPPQPKPEKADSKLQRQLDAVKREEKRAKAEVARERTRLAEQVEQLQEQWRPKIEAAKRFEALKGRARTDLGGVLRELGLGDADFESAARYIYGLSPAGRADPRYREQAERQLRDNEQGTRLEQTERELRELRESITQKERLAQAADATASFIEEAVSAVDATSAPLTARLVSASPKAARARFAAAAEELLTETGEIPDHDDVIERVEENRRAQLEEMGLDPEAVTKTPPKQKPSVAVAKQKPARTLSSDLRTPTQPRSAPRSREELKADVVRELMAGAAD